MQFTPKKIDEQLKDRAVWLVTEHQQEYPSLAAACEAVAKQVGLVRRACGAGRVRASMGERTGITTVESDEIRRLKAVNRRLREHVAIRCAAATSSSPVFHPDVPKAVAAAIRGDGPVARSSGD